MTRAELEKQYKDLSEVAARARSTAHNLRMIGYAFTAEAFDEETDEDENALRILAGKIYAAKEEECIHA